MSQDLLIQPLDPADYPLPADPFNPGFTDLVNQQLAGVATGDDGFDPVVEDLISIVDALDSGLALLAGADGGDLDETFAEILGYDTTPFGQAVTDFATAADAFDAGVNDLGTLLTGSTPPAPPTPGTANCATLAFGDVQQGTTKSINISITNNSGVAITILGLVVVGDNVGNIFSLSNTYQNTQLGPGASLPLTILAYAVAAAVQLYTSTLTVNTDQPNPQPCFTLTANVTPGAVGPGGGGGGGTGGGGGGGGGGCGVTAGPNRMLVCVL